jgi:putative DNA primase/helicase
MNDLPNVPDQANALEPRLNVLYFGNSYVGREDLGLKLRLRKEAEAGKLINFALAGLKDLRLAKKFVMPETARLLIKQLRELTTPVSAFIADCCELPPPGDRYYVIVDQLYDAWAEWCKHSGRNPSVKQQFGRWFTAACPSATTTRVRLNGKRHRIYEGVQLADWVYSEWLGVERIK